MTRYLKGRRDGWIFEWDPILAKNPDVYEVTEEEAYPERFIPTEAMARVEAVAVKKGRKKRESINLHTDDIPDAPGYSNSELNAEASRGLPS